MEVKGKFGRRRDAGGRRVGTAVRWGAGRFQTRGAPGHISVRMSMRLFRPER